MGRYSYPCPGDCGAQITQKTGLQDSQAVAHQLCPACQEKARDAIKDQADHRRPSHR
jgi:hypothetical protein